tara:strand:+ start:1304 stop:2275 length:972 start_codon:yes stop_codon:yes gene_type:complete
MLTKSKPSWSISENLITPESAFKNRRAILKTIGISSILTTISPNVVGSAVASTGGLNPNLFSAKRNLKYELDRPLNTEKDVTTYNNFYEFGSHKLISKDAQKLQTKPWTVTIDGMVEKPITIDAHTLISKMQLEERLYRFRCVEAWSMALPWTGFPMRDLVKFSRPLKKAKYVVMETFMNSAIAKGQKQFWYPWPYREGLTIGEATNELALIGVGAYGKPLPKQMGAPLRLVVPWKYGFKSIKSIVRFSFTDKRPVSFWETVQSEEYGFWANVNPKVPHARWSQETERVLGGGGKRIKTLIYNGYEEQVAGLYRNLKGESLYY